MVWRTPPAPKSSATPSEAPRRASTGTLIAWLIGLAFVGSVVWLLHAAIAFSGCGGSEFGPIFKSGGAASGGSLLVAEALAGPLWLAAGLIGFRLRRGLGRLFAGSVGSYVVTLVVLWNVSPLFWGSRHC